MQGSVALVSPEDVGCGPYTRPWGKGMPESSFLLFDTKKALKARVWHWRRRFRLRFPVRVLDFFGAHITYNLPKALTKYSWTWKMMEVHASPIQSAPIYDPDLLPKHWSQLAYYRYGLGNFYSLAGHVTHYHNWYDRLNARIAISSDKAEIRREHCELPLEYVGRYTDVFLQDLQRGGLRVPTFLTDTEASISVESGAPLA
jgi:hypothetical protein